MKKIDVFTLTLKILGIYFLIPLIEGIAALITIILQLISMRNTMGDFDQIGPDGYVAQMLLFGLIPVIIYAFAVWTLLSRSAYWAARLVPEAQHDELVQLGLQKEVILQVAFVIGGLVLLVRSLAFALNAIWLWLLSFGNREKDYLPGGGDFDFHNVLACMAGALCILFSASLGKWLGKRMEQENNADDNTELL